MNTGTPDHDSQRKRRTGFNSVTPLMDVHSVAEVLGITVRHVQRLVAERRIPYFKVGRFVRFDPGELNEWLASTRVTALRPACRDTCHR